MNAPKPWAEMGREELDAAHLEAVRQYQSVNAELSKINSMAGKPAHREKLREAAKSRLEDKIGAIREINVFRKRRNEKLSGFGRRSFRILMDLVVVLEGVPLPQAAQELIDEVKQYPQLIEEYSRFVATEV